MSPQQKIAERIYELLPHKKELGFLCYVKIKDYPRIHDVFMVVDITNHLNGERTCRITGFNDYFEADELEIIGQPIRLADILLAINQYTDNGIYILDDGTFADRDDIVIGDYNLEKDNILDQSNSFCEFLLEILK